MCHAAQATEKLKHDSIDHLFSTTKALREATGATPSLWKADIDAAYRCGVQPPDRFQHSCLVCTLSGGSQFTRKTGGLLQSRSQLMATCGLPNIMLCHLGRLGRSMGGTELAPSSSTSLLYFCTCRSPGWRPTCVCACCGSVQCRHCRYVDDFFGPLQEGCLEHGVQHFVELVRLLLGKKAIANRKVEWSRNHSPLVILGVEVLITDEGFRCSPSPKHTAKWLAVIADSMANDRMCPGTASKLAGALSWGAQNMFFRQALAFTMFMFALVCVCCVRFGRAMLRPLFTQQYGRSSTINEPLRLALAWWQEVLQLQIADTKEWYAQQQQVQPKPPPLIPTM